MHKAVLHIGSNIGDRNLNLERSLKLIGESAGEITKISGIYETEAWGITDQNKFLNQALEIDTTLNAFELLKTLMSIELALGRERIIQWGPRLIDIDIIFFDNLYIETEELSIPHPRMQERNFVLLPLNEIIPKYEHPVLKKSIAELTIDSKDSLSVLEVE